MMLKRMIATTACALLTGSMSALALEQGTFEAFTLNQPKEFDLANLAVIDASDFSKQWLNEYADYLAGNEIPVILLYASAAELDAIREDHPGLHIGSAPEPVRYLEELLEVFGVSYYPVVMEYGTAWQSKNH